ncbi:MAG TPA: flavin reductase family protein [Gammaproteobacteria bacterium]|nr:flavin reductase family protein [Gammaproteobacteria bacterium]
MTTKQMTNPALLLKQAMRRMAASVSVVSTADAAGRGYAMTATAITSVSLEPPSLLVCVNQQAGIYSALEQGRPFCINILNAKQRTLAELCSQGPQTRDRFGIGQWRNSASGIPYLADAQANIFCINDKSLCYASHTIFIGRVEGITMHGEVSPLIYLDGTYMAVNTLQDTKQQTIL